MSKWKKTTLGKVLSAGGGKIQTGPFGSQLHASDYVGLGIPCIMPANMKSNRVNLSGIAFIAEKDAKRLSHHLVQAGDIVYSRRGDVTQKALIREQEAGYFCGTGCLLVRPGDSIDPEFLIYHLSTPTNQNWIVKQAVGATMPNLNTAILSAVPLNVPPNKEIQKKVAATLSALDAKIDCNNRINAELEALAKTLYDYWFVQFDFPDANGKPYKSSGGKMVYNATLKREIPEGWAALELADVISRSGTGLNPRDNFQLGNGSNYYVTIKNVTNGRITLDDKCDKIDDEAMKIIDRRSQLQTGDVLFTSIEPVGVTYLIQEKPENWNINESVFTLRPDYKKTTPEHLFCLLSSKEMKVFTKNSSTGSIHKGIRHGVLNTYPLPYSGKGLIERFSVAVKPMLKKMDVLEKENQQLAQLRDWLLPLLMNGQVTVA